ncbi:MAG: InlB B-repeat-containing protein [Paludibacteraceae bacterium]|nr:InlB B-repeat-containing protein [Paludibacteraceae bacterium]
MSIVEKTSTGGTVDGASWTAPAVGSIKEVTFKNGIGTSLTVTAVYVITADEVMAAPTITAPTTDQAAAYAIGETITALSVTATGNPAPTYQWYKNTSASTTGATSISGAEAANYTPDNSAASDLYYYCVATNSEGTAQSPYFHVTVSAVAPTIPTSGATETVSQYADVSWTADATGGPAPTYQWYSNTTATNTGGSEIAGANNATYIPSTATAGTYYYYFVATNSAGSATSEVYTLTVNAVTTYTVTLNPAGGTIEDATGWTLNGSNYEKTVAEGTNLTLPTFTKTNRTFKTWRNALDADVASPVTVNADMTLTAVWNATVEQVLYSWESPAGTPIEIGGTAITKDQEGNDVAGNANVNATLASVTVDYKSIVLNGKISSGAWSGNYVQITTDEAIKTGDKVKVTACTTKNDASKKGSPRMYAGTTPSATSIFSDGGTFNDIVADPSLTPNTKTFEVPDGVNTSVVTMTRNNSSTNCWITKLQIVRESQVEEGDLLTVTFNTNGGSTIAPVQVASGMTVARPADPTKADYTFVKWQLAGVDYNFTTAVTTNITLDAVWTQSYTVTYKDGTTTLGTEDVWSGESPTEYATYETKAHYTFDGWFSNEALTTTADPSTATIIEATTFYGKWTEDAKAVVTFQVDGVTYGSPVNVYVGDKVASPNSPVKSGYVFKGWYNGAVKYDFTVALADATPITLDAQWDAADANHYTYAYNDDFHFDGDVYKTPEGKVDAAGGASNVALSATAYNLFSGAAGITSIVANNAIYDSKSNWVNAYLKLKKDDATSNLVITIAADYTATLTMKMGGYSNNPTVTLNDGLADVTPTSGTVGGKASTEDNFNEIVYDLTEGTYTLTAADQTLYISHIELVTTSTTPPPTPDYTRTGLSAGKIGTLFVGYATSSYSGATFYELAGKSADGQQITFEEVTGQLEADKPYIFEASADHIDLYYADPSATQVAEADHNGLYGVTSEQHIAASTEIYYFSNNQLYKADTFSGGASDLTVAANRCYIKIAEVPGGVSPKPGRKYISLHMNGGQVATGIEDVQSDNVQCTKVLINGTLFILRGEKMYDTTGRFVK